MDWVACRSMTALNNEAAYINYCYSQQCVDRNVAPVNIAEGGDLANAWNTRPAEPPCPAGKVRECCVQEDGDGSPR